MAVPDEEILALVATWVRAKAETFRFGREEYSIKVGAYYAKEHNLSPDDASSLQSQMRLRMDELNDLEYKARWALYEKAKERFCGST